MKRKLILLSIVGIALFVLYFFYSHAFIEVTFVNAAADQDLQYILSVGPDEQKTKLGGDTKTSKQLVKRGEYELVVTQNDQSYYAHVSTGGFFGTTSVKASLAKEKSRKFIGNNPGPCLYMVDKVLLSQPCGDTLQNLMIHVPATANQPTHTQKVSTTDSANVAGVVTLSSGSYALLLKPAPEVRPISSNGSLGEPLPLPPLSATSTYNIERLGDGFVVYNSGGSEVISYVPASKQAQSYPSAKPQRKDLSLYSVSTFGNTVALTYASPAVDEDPHSNPEAVRQTNTQVEPSAKGAEVILLSSNQEKHIKLPDAPYKARLCDKDRFCVLKVGGKMDIYDVSSDKPKRLYTLSGVVDIENNPNGFLLVSNTGVVKYDITKKEGFLAYSFGDYGYESITATNDGFVLALSDANEDLVALQVSDAQENSDNIDKKVADLKASKAFRGVNAYDKFIFISPFGGELKYIESLGGFWYDPELIKIGQQEIERQVNKAGIDRSVYTVVNTLQ